MAKARAIVKRRRTVQNIRKITRTMQLIATARFQAAFKRAVAARPYTERISELVEQVARRQGELQHPLLRVNTESHRSVLIVITSNRGLCGGYNASLQRAAAEHLRERAAAGEKVDLYAIGKKGINHFRFLGREMARRETQFEDKPQWSQVEPIAAGLLNLYSRQVIDAVFVTSMRFISAATQRVETLELLPIQPPVEETGIGQLGLEYEFLPSAPELLARLLPEMVKVRLFQCFIDAAVSEQVARMVAMKSATDAAGDMVRLLAQQYNRARQSQITLELLDIVGGAEALK